MNFFASAEYLDILGEVYFPHARKQVRDVELDGKVIRLLEVNGKLVAESTFLDYHLPLESQECGTCNRGRVHAPWVAHETIEIERFEGQVSDELNIAPFIDWSLFPDFESYMDLVRRRPHMKEYERRRRKFIQAHGKLQFAYKDRGDDVLPTARQWKSQQLRLTGIPDWFAKPTNIAFFDVMAARDLLVSATLRWNGQLIAVFLGVECQSRLSGWLFTYSPAPDLRKYSVGHQLLLSLLQYSHEAGHREFDFSIGPDPYKLGYATYARVLRPLGPRPLPAAFVRGTKKRAKSILGVLPLFTRPRAIAGNCWRGPRRRGVRARRARRIPPVSRRSPLRRGLPRMRPPPHWLPIAHPQAGPTDGWRPTSKPGSRLAMPLAAPGTSLDRTASATNWPLSACVCATRRIPRPVNPSPIGNS